MRDIFNIRMILITQIIIIQYLIKEICKTCNVCLIADSFAMFGLLADSFSFVYKTEG